MVWKSSWIFYLLVFFLCVCMCVRLWIFKLRCFFTDNIISLFIEFTAVKKILILLFDTFPYILWYQYLCNSVATMRKVWYIIFLKKGHASEVTSTFIFLELGDFVHKKTLYHWLNLMNETATRQNSLKHMI